MNDDDLVSAYGICDNSTIALIGGGEAPAPPSRKSTAPITQEGSIEAIQAELASINKNIVPALDSFLASISPEADTTTATAPSATSSAPPPATTTAYTPLEDPDMEHRRLGELLLQSLLRLDVINMDGTWTDARKERKVAVKTVQGLLDKLDGGWRARNDRIKSS